MYCAAAERLPSCAPIRIDASFIFYLITHGIGRLHSAIVTE